MKEEYKDIEGYEWLYQVSNYGNVNSLNYYRSGKEKKLKPIKEKILKLTKDKDGYLYVGLYQQGKQKAHKVHRLVAQAFIDNPNNYPQVNHKDEDKTNNHVTNLEWCTRSYNINYGTRNEKISKQVMCIETGLVYPSTMEVERQLGFAQSHISMCCRGKRKTAYGFHWKYVS